MLHDVRERALGPVEVRGAKAEQQEGDGHRGEDHGPVKVTVRQCTTKTYTGTAKFTASPASARATLSRGDVVYARGATTPSGGLVLAERRPLASGDYTLTLRVRHGLRDWRIGHPVYLFGLIHVREARWQRVREGTRSVALPIIVALLATYTFQYVNVSRIFVGYGLLYATVFVLTPYLAARGFGHLARIHPALLPSAADVLRPAE